MAIKLSHHAVPISVLSVSLFALGCSKASSPDDVDVSKLKPALNLEVIPGDQKLYLRWQAINNEDDFSGYSIYFSKNDAATVIQELGVSLVDSSDPHRYAPIVFKDQKEENIPAIRTALAKHFNWDATQKANVASKEDFTPFFRCNTATTDQAGSCAAITEANEENRANGVMTLEIDGTADNGLLNGTDYTIFISATLDSGKKIASPTSNVLRVAPRAVTDLATAVTFDGNSQAAGTGAIGYDLSTGTPVKIESFKTTIASLYCLNTNTSLTNGTSVDLYFETSSGSPVIVGANAARISSAGQIQLADGTAVTSDLISNPNRLGGKALLPAVTPALEAITTMPKGNDLGSPAGYSRCGQSVYLNNNSLYAIAYLDGTNTRYALLETGTFNTSSKQFDTLKIAIGKGGDRRL